MRLRVVIPGLLTVILAGCGSEESGALATQRRNLVGPGVLDIDTRAAKFPKVEPHAVELANGVTLFAGEDALHGEELWRSDGTEAGTVLVRDLLPGLVGSNPYALTRVNASVFFLAWADGLDWGLYKTDGTAAGTVLVKRFSDAENPDGYTPERLTAFQGSVYFVYRSELWKSDGTEAGTRPFVALTSEYGLEMLATGSTLFYSVRASNSLELWKTDGTLAGTVRVKTFTLPPFSGGASLLNQVGGTLFFFAGRDLWKSNGTEAGTVLLASSTRSPRSAAVLNNTLFFSRDMELWKSDGTALGTVLVRNTAGTPQELTAQGGLLFFICWDSASGLELWKSNGTAAGTVLVSDLRPGSDDSQPSELFARPEGLYFIASPAAGTHALYRTNGSVSGTQALTTWPSPGDTYSLYGYKPHALNNVGSALFFALPEDSESGTRWMWRTDGTPAGTRPLTGLWTGTRGSQVRSRTLAVIGGTVFFAAAEGNTRESLWKSDGTAAGTVKLRTFEEVAPEGGTFAWLHVPESVRVGTALFFTADDGTHGYELWRSDGTVAGTRLVRDLDPGPGSSYPSLLTAVGSRVFFSASTPAEGSELWLSDGTEAGTVLVKDLEPGGSSGSPDWLTVVGSTLYFSAADGAGNDALWKSNGTAAGTVQVAGGFPHLDQAAAVNGVVYFIARSTDGRHQLWRSNGTAAGTVLVKGGFESAELLHASAPKGRLYFNADDGTHGSELWRSDGTLAGTFMVKDLFPGTAPSNPLWLKPVPGGMVFTATDGVHGFELWKTDGTAAGTVRLTDLVPGPGNGVRVPFPDDDRVTELLAVEDRGLVLFTGIDAAGGAELWQTDGTVAGTVLRKDLVPGAESSEPASFARLGDRLFLFAGDKAYGREPRFLHFPTELGSRTGEFVAQGTTCSALDQTSVSCGFTEAPDVSFAWTAPYAGTFTFSTEGSSYDTLLEVSDPASGDSLGCNDDSDISVQSSVTVSVAAGQRVVVTLDGYSGLCGSYVLGITPEP